MNWYMLAFWILFFTCIGAFCFGMWDELGRTGRRVVKAAKRFWRMQQGDVLTVGLLLTIARVTMYKHGGWLLATALLSLACGMAA